jgi:hypothetical protein
MKVYYPRSGETWDMIAYKLFGNEFKSTDIIAVNPRLANILVFTGDEHILIPDNVETKDRSTLAPWRR